jgi:DNA-binding transcriptional ArsR family regulator
MQDQVGEKVSSERVAMLEPILGSVNAERVLLYLLAREEGYAREIARFFGAHPDTIQKQLTKFEAGGVCTSKEVGRTVLYQFNPRYAFLVELKSLLQKALEFYPEEERERLVMSRRRPRRRGKPL